MKDKSAPQSSFRPRFSIRSLTIFVTAFCIYFGTWELTRRFGTPPEQHSGALAPFIFYTTTPTGEPWLPWTRHYYFWCFGFTCKLPMETKEGNIRKLYPRAFQVH